MTVLHLITKRVPLAFTVDTGEDGGMLTIDARDESGAFLNGYKLEARIVTPE